MNNILEIKDLKIQGFDGACWKPIVNQISLTLEKGEILGIIGESGAGKSSIGLAAMGYTRTGCRISGGTVLFNGKELTIAAEKDLRRLRGSRIAYVAQSAAAAFNPAHRIIRQFVEIPVQHGLSGAEDAEKKAVSLYHRLFLPDPETFGYRYPYQVSGGQLQRAMVAMAMACDPDIIIFDEPTTALDVTTQIEVLTAIREIVGKRETGAIYITHDLAVVAQLADQIMVLHQGNLVEKGKARDILTHPRHEYTRKLLSVRKLRRSGKCSAKNGRMVLTLRKVSAGYANAKGVKAIDNISLNIRKGQTVAVVGESGSGKTTAARVITGLLPLSEGEILFDNKKLAPALKKRNKDTLRRLQMIYQMPDVALNPRHKIRKILGRPLHFYFGMDTRARENKISELLDMIELPSQYSDRYPSELSGGEKQRICIARALASQPDLIICDEITSALDQLVAEGILKLLQNLQKDMDVSYLFITHDLATVKAISDEVIVMLQGRIVEQGTRDNIMTNPQHDYTKLLLSSVPEMDPDWLDNLLCIRDGNS